MFRKVLIANRGEIAVRIAQTLQEMGIRAAVVYSDADRTALHVARADEAYRLVGVTAAETYLRGDRLIEIARSCGAEAIHPGYGFLSENAEFAQACGDAGLVFIGPTPAAIRAMGDKISAKRLMQKAGVPVVPGWSTDGDADASTLRREAQRIGYPILVKAAAGGGGKGMRLVRGESELAAAFEAASRESKAAFSDHRVFLEKYIDRPRHVEFQIFGDHHGRAVHLFERECSIQRRYQKIIEETPCVALFPERRAAMGEAAVAAARAIGYTNAGTVEFILDESGAFYFLEVNTRLQVEHPVTELTTHRDLVAAQVRVAAGEPLPFTQDALSQDGHAMECRIYAEDPENQFLPSIGTLRRFLPPAGPGIRVDTGVTTGTQVSVHYDAMLAKLIVWAGSRHECLARMRWALRHFVVLGVRTNIEYLQHILAHPEFVAGRIHTHFLDEHPISIASADVSREALAVAAWASRGDGGLHLAGSGDGESDEAVSPWRSTRGWRAY
ncbi:MAG: acetyl-CoA carboxylase biotin carboxylase subunit [Phycisphaerae bacterium]|nr:acetyl-CoA carboxylase biotin carboxylase subunit [Phycisphaerae bacterium]